MPILFPAASASWPARHMLGGIPESAFQGAGLSSWELALRSAWLPYLAALLLTLGLALGAVRWLGPRGFMDVPGGRKQHGHPVPRIGGIALLLGLALFGATGRLAGLFSPLAWTAFAALALVGVLDDRFDLRPRWKALGSLAAAALLAAIGTLDFLAQPSPALLWGVDLSALPLLVGALLLMLFWGVPQAFNLIDGADGLSLGFTLITLVVLSIGGVPTPHLSGAVAALFVLNWPKGRIFLGDSGALCLGLLVAMLAFKAFGRTRPEAILWLFAYPIADVSQVVLTRWATDRPVWRADQNHSHHRWARILGPRACLGVPILWLQAALCASGAVLPGPWRALAWVGLAALVAQSAVFVISSRRKHQGQAARVPENGRTPANALRLPPPGRSAVTGQAASGCFSFPAQSSPLRFAPPGDPGRPRART